MCVDPVTITAATTALTSAASSAATAVGTVAGPMSTALSIGSSAAGFIGQQQAADASNAAAYANARSASQAAQRKYEDEQRKYVYDSRARQQEGYEAVMRGRQSYATGVASSGSAGIDASSVSFASLLAAERQKTAENVARSRTKQDDLTASFESRMDTIEAEAQARINSKPMTAGPSPLALGINIASSGLKYGKDQGWFDPKVPT